ncbi:MAG: HAD family hydrolase [Defluviitaleaceae bacterium]|nr:HAD family hydrolase [Defluviitaleaceae bacterium]
MDIKMIVCDLDGTLLRSDKTVSERTLDVLAKCRQRGIKFAVATARSKFNLEKVMDEVMPDVLIYHGGAVAMANGVKLRESIMDSDLATKLMASILKRGATRFSGESDEGYFYYGERISYADFLEGLGLEVAEIDPGNTSLPPLHKIGAIVDVDKAKEVLEAHPEVGMIAYTGESWVRFALKDATKWRAIEAVAAHLGIDTANIAAFGDDWNDVEMIENCGIGVAMANGIDQAKAVANFVCASNDDDGIAQWIENHLRRVGS